MWLYMKPDVDQMITNAEAVGSDTFAVIVTDVVEIIWLMTRR